MANLQIHSNHSTLSDFCAHLLWRLAVRRGQPDTPVKGDGEETLFVFHASDGDISVLGCRSLAR